MKVLTKNEVSDAIDIIQTVMEYEEPKNIIKYARVSKLWNYVIKDMLNQYGISDPVEELCDIVRLSSIQEKKEKVLRPYLKPKHEAFLQTFPIKSKRTKELIKLEKETVEYKNKFLGRGYPDSQCQTPICLPSGAYLKNKLLSMVSITDLKLIELLGGKSTVEKYDIFNHYIPQHGPGKSLGTTIGFRRGECSKVSVEASSNNIIKDYQSHGGSLSLGISKGEDNLKRKFFIFDVLQLVDDSIYNNRLFFTQTEEKSTYWWLEGYDVNTDNDNSPFPTISLAPEETLEMISKLAQGAVFRKKNGNGNTFVFQALSNKPTL